MAFLSSLIYFIIVIGVLVLIHEFGHFIAARISGMRVDIFSVGMGTRLFGFNKKTGFTFGKLPNDFDGEGYTDYRLSLLPVGGYVKICGMVDESMDTEFAKSEPKPWEFRSKHPLLKAFTISAGVIMNAVLAIVIFAGIAYFQGSYHNGTTGIGYIEKGSFADSVGLQVNDKIIAINDKSVHTWQEMLDNFALKDLGNSRKITISRNGQKQDVYASSYQVVKILTGEKKLGIFPDNAFVYLSSVETIKPAGKAGLMEGDTILMLKNEPIKNINQFIDLVKANKGQPIEIKWKRGKDTLTHTVTPDASGLIGVGISEFFYGPIIHKQYGFFEAIHEGFSETVNSIDLFAKSLVQIFKGNISVKQSLGGPIMIAQKASERAEMGIASFLNFVALLSITLAVINILPFPALDGGHLVFIIIEWIIRREIPIKIKMWIQQAGIIILILLMIFIFYNDIARILGF